MGGRTYLPVYIENYIHSDDTYRLVSFSRKPQLKFNNKNKLFARQ